MIIDKRILKEFLKAGYVENYFYNSTIEGFSQSNSVSLLLANSTLNGLEGHIGKDFL